MAVVLQCAGKAALKSASSVLSFDTFQRRTEDWTKYCMMKWESSLDYINESHVAEQWGPSSVHMWYWRLQWHPQKRAWKQSQCGACCEQYKSIVQQLLSMSACDLWNFCTRRVAAASNHSPPHAGTFENFNTVVSCHSQQYDEKKESWPFRICNLYGFNSIAMQKRTMMAKWH